MDATPRACPFCANTRLTVTTFGDKRTPFVAVVCSECGAMGPRASASDPPGYAEHLWNQRFGVWHRALSARPDTRGSRASASDPLAEIASFAGPAAARRHPQRRGMVDHRGGRL